MQSFGKMFYSLNTEVDMSIIYVLENITWDLQEVNNLSKGTHIAIAGNTIHKLKANILASKLFLSYAL